VSSKSLRSLLPFFFFPHPCYSRSAIQLVEAIHPPPVQFFHGVVDGRQGAQLFFFSIGVGRAKSPPSALHGPRRVILSSSSLHARRSGVFLAEKESTRSSWLSFLSLEYRHDFSFPFESHPGPAFRCPQTDQYSQHSFSLSRVNVSFAPNTVQSLRSAIPALNRGDTSIPPSSREKRARSLLFLHLQIENSTISVSFFPLLASAEHFSQCFFLKR